MAGGGKMKKYMAGGGKMKKYMAGGGATKEPKIEAYKDYVQRMFGGGVTGTKGAAKGGSGRPVPLLSQYLIDKS